MDSKTFWQNMNDYKVFTFATNHSGSKIFCRMAYKKKTVAKGFYDFDKDKFFVTNYLKQNFPQGIGRNSIKKYLKVILNLDYDWEL